MTYRFSDRLVPWVHYVPVQLVSGLSSLSHSTRSKKPTVNRTIPTSTTYSHSSSDLLRVLTVLRLLCRWWEAILNMLSE